MRKITTMNPGETPSAAHEWRRYWPLPVAAAVGYAMLGLQTYAIGPFVVPLEAEFVYSIYTLAIAPNLVPLLMEKGSDAMAAAQIASLVGVVAIAARLSAGLLLDLFPVNLVGACIFLLPVADCGLMLLDDPGFIVLLLAVASFGMTIGAEFDVIIYLTARQFGLKAFGALFGGVITAGALGGAIGPVTSGWIHDEFGNYDALLVMLMALMAVGAVLIAAIGRPKQQWSAI